VSEGFSHVPVLLPSVLAVLDPRKGESVLDVTLGLGGHAHSFLQRIGPAGRLIGLDADEENLVLAQKTLAHEKNVQFIHANFAHLASLELPRVDIVFADLGLSSPHIDDPSRGFTFREEVPLDLRYDRSQGATAAEWIARASEEEVQKTLRESGELPSAHRLAQILKERQPTTTTAVVLAAESVYRWQGKVEQSEEELLIIKTKRELFDRLRSRVQALHSYSVPEIIALPILEGNEGYLKWLADEVSESGVK